MRNRATKVLKRADELDAGELAQWRALLQQRLDLQSPYFSPEFFQAVAAVSRTARVVIARRDGQVTSVLPLHKTAAGIAVPIGGPLNDIHGSIARSSEDVQLAQALSLAGATCMNLRHVPIGLLTVAGRGRHHAFHVVDLSAGLSAWEGNRRELAKSAFRAIRTRAEKAAKMHGALTFRFADTDTATWRQLMVWKREQYRQTRQPDPLSRHWVQALIERLCQADADASLRGQVSSLWFGDRLVAAHLGLRSRQVLHYWFPAYDPDFAELSPGNLLLYRMIAAAAADGCQAVHLGAGDVRYKLEFANLALPVVGTTVFAASLAGRAAATAGSVLNQLGSALPESWRAQPTKAWRRLDRELALRAA